MKIFLPLLAGIILVNGLACSDSNFASDSKKGANPNAADSAGGSIPSGEAPLSGTGDNTEGTPSAPQADPNTGADSEVPPPEAGDVEGGSVVVGPPDAAELKALASCMKAWGPTAPVFSKSAVRKIFAIVTIGSKGVTLSDEQKTTSPALTIVHASVNVLGTPEWNLLNPNGWYCVMTAVNVVTQLTVNIDKDAHLADSVVGVNVLSDVDASVSAVGVNVASKIKVVKK